MEDKSDMNNRAQDIEQLKKDKENLEWAIHKTNDMVKALYKELEKKNDELERLNQLKSDFVSIVAHELRTPIGIVREAMSQMGEGLLGPLSKDQAMITDLAIRTSDRLIKISNDLLDLAKIEAGKMELKFQETDLIRVADQVTAAFDRRIRQKGLEFKKNYSAGQVPAFIDPDKLTQVLTNLLGNAVKFTEKGWIELRIQEKEETIECSVLDTGPGMAAEDLPKLFDKFEQFGKPKASGEKGTGLGLSISKSIVEAHGGKIRAESTLGKGTRMIFEVPKQRRE